MTKRPYHVRETVKGRRFRPLVQEQREGGTPWPLVPDRSVRLTLPDYPYTVDVEFVRSEESGYVPVGISVRRDFPIVPQLDAGPATPPRWSDDLEPDTISVREVRRMRLASYVEAALAALTSSLEERGEAIREVMVPRGRPERGRSAKWYLDLLESARALKAQGKSPVKEIARRKRVSENLVHQWLYRARRLERQSEGGREGRSRRGKEER